MNTIRRYVARPCQIEAVSWDGRFDGLPEAWRATGLLLKPRDDEDSLLVRTLDGPTWACLGDYVVRGTAGEFYPVRKLIFEHKYAPAGEPA